MRPSKKFGVEKGGQTSLFLPHSRVLRTLAMPLVSVSGIDMELNYVTVILCIKFITSVDILNLIH